MPPPRGGERPVVPPGIQEFFLPPGDSATYSPAILGAARVSFTDPEVGGLIGLGVVLVGAFIWAESRAHEPIVPLGLFRNRTFTASVIAIQTP